MNSYWIGGLTGEAKEKRIRQVKGYKEALADLEKILKEHYLKDDEYRDYSDPGWMANQIARNERNAVIKDILKLIDIT